MISYVINLDKRVERWLYVREHLAEVGIRPVRFTAIPTKPGWKGCRDSHLAIMEQCRNEDTFTIYEDDVNFLNPNSSAYLIEEAMAQLPPDWDCLYLGASPQVPQERYSSNLFKLCGAWTTHAIIWHNIKGGAIEYILNHKQDIGKWDVFLANIIQSNFNCFVIFPIVATQIQFPSDTCTRSDVSTILRNFNLYCV